MGTRHSYWGVRFSIRPEIYRLMMEDWQLLREYVDHGSEAAFTELMDRHLDLVYSTAVRRLGNPQAAEEVAQYVFCLLTRKARKIQPGGALVGWLYQTTCF